MDLIVSLDFLGRLVALGDWLRRGVLASSPSVASAAVGRGYD